eukprot:Lithocolla_globosa_v1_NODE_1483_length_2542_cov_29.874950.p2 type:complete len:307 gc:universal NODE_1483_length_2542_cov_29.874950:84-1004(+)
MKRGQYRLYARDPSVPVPKQTLSSQRIRRRKLEYSEEEDEDESFEENMVDVLTGEDTDEMLPNAESPFADEPIPSLSEDEELLSEGDEAHDPEYDTEEEFFDPYDSDGSEDFEHREETPSYVPLDTKIENLLNDFPDEPLYPGARVSVFESFFLCLFFAIRHKMSDVGLDDLFALITLHCPTDVLMSDVNRFLGLFKGLSSDWKVHDYCPKCAHAFKPGETTHQCTGDPEDQFRYAGGREDQKKKRPKAAFIEVPLENGLADKFMSPDFCEQINYKNTRCKLDPTDIEDVYDGERWKANPFFSEYG